MWVDYKTAPNLMLAEMWKEIIEGEGLPVRLLPGERHPRLRGVDAVPHHGAARP